MANKKYRRKKYTKQQILRNRFAFIIVCAIILAIAIFGIIKLIESAFAEPAMAVVDDSITSGSSSISVTSSSLNEDEDSSLVDDSMDDSNLESSSVSVSSYVEEVDMTYPGDDIPLLVNKQNPIPEDFEPDLVSVFDYQFASVGAQALRDMINVAANEGIDLNIISAYRSIEHQTNNYNNRVEQYMDEGKTEEEAQELTEMFIAPPLNSEHSLGLAVDFNSLYQSFEDTEEFEWLVENCATFGFILRYNKDKVAITGYSYEPWHYRFVGTNHSHEIMERGITLEEYLAE